MRALVLAALLCCAITRTNSADPADVRVIVNAKSGIRKLDRRTISEAFLKKRTHWSDDLTIDPVDLVQKSSVREQFSHAMLGRDVASVRRYWAQAVFSGRGVPPPELAGEDDVVKYVGAHKGAIGYVSITVKLTDVTVVEVE